ncbi:membrane protein [Herbaspirillum seropedicae]|nr:membrane protein [Herbaspirillum seropedicae]
MPGRPSTAWMEAVSRLLEHLPIPAWISADADPAGVDIACSVGALWTRKGLQWEPYLMGLEQWQATTQYWPLNAHDRRLITALLDRAELPSSLRALCAAMLEEGRKAEQEAWI